MRSLFDMLRARVAHVLASIIRAQVRQRWRNWPSNLARQVAKSIHACHGLRLLIQIEWYEFAIYYLMT
jgi:hypothetical protein